MASQENVQQLIQYHTTPVWTGQACHVAIVVATAAVIADWIIP